MAHLEKRLDGLLEVESAFYESNRDDLLMKFPNRFLLIHGENLEGHFETMDDAITEGVLRFGSEPFLIRRAGPETSRRRRPGGFDLLRLQPLHRQTGQDRLSALGEANPRRHLLRGQGTRQEQALHLPFRPRTRHHLRRLVARAAAVSGLRQRVGAGTRPGRCPFCLSSRTAVQSPSLGKPPGSQLSRPHSG